MEEAELLRKETPQQADVIAKFSRNEGIVSDVGVRMKDAVLPVLSPSGRDKNATRPADSKTFTGFPHALHVCSISDHGMQKSRRLTP